MLENSKVDPAEYACVCSQQLLKLNAIVNFSVFNPQKFTWVEYTMYEGITSFIKSFDKVYDGMSLAQSGLSSRVSMGLFFIWCLLSQMPQTY